MKKKFQIKPQDYGFPSKIGGMTIKTITWKDFPAKAPQNTWFLAYTYWNTNWTSTVKNGKGTVLPSVSIGPKAWTRAHQDFKLLQHQTGHYWIACHCALQFMKRINYTQKQPEGIIFADWAQKVWKNVAGEFAQQQKRYDKQTYHYLIEEEQKRWMSEMIAKFNSYHKFFQEKKKQELSRQALVRAQIGQIVKSPQNQGGRGVNRSLPATRKLPSINSKPTFKGNIANIKQANQVKQYSIKKTNGTIGQNIKQPTRNPRVFEKAKNTILGNIQLLEGLK